MPGGPCKTIYFLSNINEVKVCRSVRVITSLISHPLPTLNKSSGTLTLLTKATKLIDTVLGSPQQYKDNRNALIHVCNFFDELVTKTPPTIKELGLPLTVNDYINTYNRDCRDKEVSGSARVTANNIITLAKEGVTVKNIAILLTSTNPDLLMDEIHSYGINNTAIFARSFSSQKFENIIFQIGLGGVEVISEIFNIEECGKIFCKYQPSDILKNIRRHGSKPGFKQYILTTLDKMTDLDINVVPSYFPDIREHKNQLPRDQRNQSISTSIGSTATTSTFTNGSISSSSRSSLSSSDSLVPLPFLPLQGSIIPANSTNSLQSFSSSSSSSSSSSFGSDLNYANRNRVSYDSNTGAPIIIPPPTVQTKLQKLPQQNQTVEKVASAPAPEPLQEPKPLAAQKPLEEQKPLAAPKPLMDTEADDVADDGSDTEEDEEVRQKVQQEELVQEEEEEEELVQEEE